MAIHAHMVCRLTKDPELKSVGENEILNFSVATDHGYGEKKTTTFVNCSIWGKRAVTLNNMLNKGKQVVVHGEIFTRDYQTKEGEKRTSLDCRVSDVDLVGPKENNSNGAEAVPAKAVSHPGSASAPTMDEDIPFSQPVALDGIPW